MSVNVGELDVAMLSSLVGTALDEHTLGVLGAAGHPHLRRTHGFIFQHLIDDHPTVGQLAERLGVTQQAASKSVVELEKLGYVKRMPDPLDSRLRRIALTDEGHHAVHVSRQLRADLAQELLADVGVGNLKAARVVLISLLDKLDATNAIEARRVPLPAE